MGDGKFYGNKTKYSQELCLKILEDLSESTKGLHHVLRSKTEYPSPKTWSKWLKEHAWLAPSYAQARIEHSHRLANFALETSQDRSRDVINDKGNNAAVLRDRLITDVIWRLISVMNPESYAAKSKLELDAGIELIPTITVKSGAGMSDQQLGARVPELPPPSAVGVAGTEGAGQPGATSRELENSSQPLENNKDE